MGLIEVEDSEEKEIEVDSTPILNTGNFSSIISTGSTLLDLAISGTRIKGGGVPLGILMEIFGPSGAGKTSVLAEMCGSVQRRNGKVKFLDPEGRLDKEYARIYGVELKKEDYSMPNTVPQVFSSIREWKPDSSPCLVATDSLAALSTDLEMEDDEGDKMGMRRAKEFSQELRKTCRIIKDKEWVIACSNQIRQGKEGEITPGGNAISFYSSLRIRVGIPAQNKYIKKAVTFRNNKIEKTIGIHSVCSVKKSTIDDPFRAADLYIVFGYGIDDVRANLQFLKDFSGESFYTIQGEKLGKSIETAIQAIENGNLESLLKEETILLWEEIQKQFPRKRKPKER